MTTLDARLLAAHAAHDLAALTALYAEAADQANADQARGFYLTHAYVFALESGSDAAQGLRQRLVALGCEPPLTA